MGGTVVQGLEDSLEIMKKIRANKRLWKKFGVWEWRIENCQDALERAIHRYKADVIRVQKLHEKARSSD